MKLKDLLLEADNSKLEKVFNLVFKKMGFPVEKLEIYKHATAGEVVRVTFKKVPNDMYDFLDKYNDLRGESLPELTDGTDLGRNEFMFNISNKKNEGFQGDEPSGDGMSGFRGKKFDLDTGNDILIIIGDILDNIDRITDELNTDQKTRALLKDNSLLNAKRLITGLYKKLQDL